MHGGRFRGLFCSSTAVERTLHTYDSQGQILALAFRKAILSRPTPSDVLLSSEFGTNQRVEARCLPWLEPCLGKVFQKIMLLPFRLKKKGACGVFTSRPFLPCTRASLGVQQTLLSPPPPFQLSSVAVSLHALLGWAAPAERLTHRGTAQSGLYTVH